MNAKHLMTGAIVGALALAGCMSLEERLVSNDAQVRKEAEYELVAQARKSGKVDECVAAVGRVSDQQLLLAVAQSSPNGYEKEGIAAVGKISDEPNLLTIAKTAKSEKVAEAALGKLSKQESLLDVAKDAQLQAARLGAYMRLTDQDQLLQVAMTSQDGKIKRVAIDKVTDQEKLLPMVFAPKATVVPSVAQTKQMNPREAMKLKMALMKQKMAKSSAAKKGGDSAETAKKDTAGAVNVDAELVDAFIVKCANDDVFFKLVKEYSAQLTDAQCAAIKGKSKNQSLLKMIESVSDLRIVAQAKASKDPKKYGEFLDAIHNDDIRHDLCVDILQMLNVMRKEKLSWQEQRKKYGITLCEFLDNICAIYHGFCKENRAIVLRLVNELHDDEMSSLLVHHKLNEKEFDNNLVECLSIMINQSLTPEKRVVMVREMVDAKSLDDETWRKISDDLKAGKVNSLFAIKEWKGHNIGRLAMFLADAVKTSAEAEAFLEGGFLVGLDKSDSEVLMDRMLDKIVPLVGEQEKIKSMGAAKKHLTERKPSEFSFGPYYIGMPIYEAKLLTVNDGISNGVVFGYDREGLQKFAKDWKTNLKVTWIRFTRKGALKYLDCEDSTILQQTIKQYVKKEKGKANSYDYASEIKHDVEVNTYRSINLFSPTGTKLNVDSETWRVYTNSRMGVRIAHAEKSGVLMISELAD